MHRQMRLKAETTERVGDRRVAKSYYAHVYDCLTSSELEGLVVKKYGLMKRKKADFLPISSPGINRYLRGPGNTRVPSGRSRYMQHPRLMTEMHGRA